MRYLLVHGAWVGVVVGGVWMLAVRPAHSSVAATLLVMSLTFGAGSLLVRGLFAMARQRSLRIRAVSEAAAAALAREGFTLVDSLLGEQCLDMIAVDDQCRVALCDLGPGGTLVRTQIVAADQVKASSVVNDRGGTTLVVCVGDQRREVVFAARRPSHDDRPDEKEQVRITASVRWWCERLSGRQPTEPYRVSLSLGPRAFGQAFDAALARELANRGIEPDVPSARVIRK